MSDKMLPLIKEVQHLLKDYHFNQVETKEVINAVFDGIVTVVAEEGEIKVGGYGKFLKRERKERMVKHPETGQEVLSPTHNVVGFKPYKIFKDAVR